MRLPSDGDSNSDSDASVNDASVIDLILHISRLYQLGRVESNRVVLLQLTHFSFSLFIFIYWTPHARLFLFSHSFSLIMQCRLTWAGSYRLGSGLEGGMALEFAMLCGQTDRQNNWRSKTRRDKFYLYCESKHLYELTF